VASKSHPWRLKEQGIAITSFTELFKDGSYHCWSTIAAIGAQFRKSDVVEAATRSYHQKLEEWVEGGRDIDRLPAEYYVVRDNGARPPICMGEPLFRLGFDPAVLDVVNSFYRLWTKLYGFDLSSHTTTNAPGSAAYEAQAWHRESLGPAQGLLVLDLMFDEGNGALEYIPASRSGRPALLPLPHAGRGWPGGVPLSFRETC